MDQKAPRQRPHDFWFACGITAGILLLIAVALRINVDRQPPVTFTYSTPVAASYGNEEQGKNSSTHVQFAESTVHPGVNNNPWGYDFDDTGDLINDEIPLAFCKYFKCANDFWSDPRNGYIVECNDGYYVRTGGYTSACNKHGGVKRTLYQH